MNLQMIIIMSFAVGILTSAVGAFSVFMFKAKSSNICFALEFSSGIMLCVLFCEALPAAFEKGSFLTVILSLVSGILLMALVQEQTLKCEASNAYVIGVNYCIRNMAEGILLGTGVYISATLGFFLLLVMLVRNTPEIIAFALSLKKDGVAKAIIFVVCVITGLFFGLGTYAGSLLGRVENEIISGVFAFCAGTMLYTALGDNLPRSHRLFNGRRTSFFCILGVLAGLIVINIE